MNALATVFFILFEINICIQNYATNNLLWLLQGNTGIITIFAWIDDEVELLLKVTHQYKAVKAVENGLGVDAKQIRHILEQSQEHYCFPSQ